MSAIGKESSYLLRMLQRRLWLERALFVLLITLGVLFHYGLLLRSSVVCLIVVDGKPAAVVASRADANRLLEEIKSEAGVPHEKVSFSQKATFRSVSKRQNPVLSDNQARDTLASMLQPVIEGAAILTNGQVIVGLPDKDTAVRTLSLLLREFTPPGPGVSAFFKEQVTIEASQVPMDKYFPSAEEAIEGIRKGTAPKGVHEVALGETAWQIARDAQISRTRLAQANPGMDLNKIHDGDQLKLPGDLPPVTVLARKDITEEIGESPLGGIRVIRVTYENGVEMKREVIGHKLPQDSAVSASDKRPSHRRRDVVR